MPKINYNPKGDGEVIITGCNNCPFCHYEERIANYRPFCSIDSKIEICQWDIEFFPVNCKLRKSNFKLTRVFK